MSAAHAGTEVLAATSTDPSFISAIRRLALSKMLHHRLSADSPCDLLPLHLVMEFARSRTMKDQVRGLAGIRLVCNTLHWRIAINNVVPEGGSISSDPTHANRCW